METTSEDTVAEKPVAKKTTAKKTTKKTTAKKATPRATKKVAETAPVENVNVEEAKTDDQTVITAPTRKTSRVSNTSANDDNVIGSRAADAALGQKNKAQTDHPVPSTKAKEEVAQDKDDSDKVALWSARNLRWTGVGYLSTGYNIVTKEAAEKWLGRQGIRKASPEEVATYYGK